MKFYKKTLHFFFSFVSFGRRPFRFCSLKQVGFFAIIESPTSIPTPRRNHMGNQSPYKDYEVHRSVTIPNYIA